MEEKEEDKSKDNFVGYEEARKVHSTDIEPVPEKAVKAATNRINPDEDTSDRG